MQCPEEITKPVIECGFRSAHLAEMLTADQIRDELICQLDAGLIKGADVARALCIAPARITEMRNEKRRVQQSEMAPLAELLGMTEKGASETKIESVYKIANLGKVAQGVWLEEDSIEPDEQQTVFYDRMRGDPPPVDLFAVTPEGSSMNQCFLPGTQLICRRVPFGSSDYKPGDYVIAERKAHDLVEMTVKRLEIDNDGNYSLHAESDDERYKQPWPIGKPDRDQHDDQEIRIIAKVIRAVRDFERLS